MLFKLKINSNTSGVILIAALATISIFLTLAGGLSILAVYEKKLYLRQTSEIQALHIAEAGVNYYRWHLAHDSGDFFDGTGSDPDAVAPNGPYDHVYQSSGGEVQGIFRLEITEPVIGSTITTIKSTGWTDRFPNIKKEVEVKYGIPSLAQYSFLTNADAWFGDTEGLRGPMHSNGGVRMDGTNDSVVSSARSTYICTSSHGCNSSNCGTLGCTWSGSECECSGVWGAGVNSDLWDYPSLTVDFDSITMDMAQIKTDAQSDGVYVGALTKGVQIIFQADGTFDVYRVNKLKSSVRQYKDTWDGSFENVSEEIDTKSFYNSYLIPTNGLIFVEDDVWVEGVVNGRVTLVSAELPDNPSKRTTIHINNNLTYLARDSNHILGLIAQNHIKIPRHAPCDLASLTIEGILLAQNGRVFRNYYETPLVCDEGLEVYGGIITNQTWTWSWSSAGVTVDGYDTTTSIFDTDATYSAPPFFPTTGEYAIITWEELQ
jgi:hypothetical protein